MTNIYFNILTDNSIYRQALWEKYIVGIEYRDFDIRLDRLPQNNIQAATRAKKRLFLPKTGSVRSNVSWLPISTHQKSDAALSELAIYREQKGIGPAVPQKNKRHSRSKSLFSDSTYQPYNANRHHVTLDDMHSEFNRKYYSPNRGLKPCNARELREPPNKQLSEFQKISMEMKAKIDAKNASKN